MSSDDITANRGRYFIRDNRFFKEFREDIAAEFEKSNQMFEIAKNSGLFNAPKPLAIEPGPSRIVFELMDEPVISIREIYIRHLSSQHGLAVSEQLFEKLGRSLASLHKGFQLDSSTAWKLPRDLCTRFGVDEVQEFERIESTERRVILHCDFGFSNIYIKKRNFDENNEIELWIIDPSPNYFMTFSTRARGPAEVDIGNLVSCMHGLFPLHRQLGCKWSSASRLLNRLLTGYEDEAAELIDKELLRRLAELTLIAYMNKRVSNSIVRGMALRMLCSSRRISGLYKDQL